MDSKEEKSKRARIAGKTKNGIWKRGNTYYVRIMVNGKLKRVAAGRERGHAEALLAELKKERATNRVLDEMPAVGSIIQRRRRVTFAEAADSYINERPHLKSSTIRGYKDAIENRLKPAFGQMYIDQITEEKIAVFMAGLSKEVTATRVNNICGPLRYILKVCHRRKLIAENPMEPIPMLREETPDIDPLTQDELNLVIQNLRPHQKPLFITLAYTGCRPAELFSLRWSDVSLEKSEMRINKGRVRGKESTTKTKSSNRSVHLFSVVKEVLEELKQGSVKHLDGYVFLRKNGLPYDRHADREWRTACRKADVKVRPSYQLRHTYASLCLQQGLQAPWVSRQLGHANLSTTFKHYAKFIKDSSTFNEEKMERFLDAKRLPSGHQSGHLG